MRVEKIICDMCGQEDPACEMFGVRTGKTYDENQIRVLKWVDICPRCMKKEIESWRKQREANHGR